MAEVERLQKIQDILKDMRGLDGLKRLFWQELNYERENKPLSTRQWSESAKGSLAEDPILFASGGEDSVFHVVYCRLASEELKRGCQRPIVDQLLRDHPYALFVFSNKAQTTWHFLNVKYDEQAEKRRLVRRIAVRPGDGLRTAAERLALLDLRGISPELFGLSPLLIQQVHDDAFDVEKVTKDFYREIANWYFWALKHSVFPEGARKEDDGCDHISVIRLITRLIFCWFIREKGLIPDTLFNHRRLSEWIDGFTPDTPDDKASVYYRAILQNLFFATLNTEMDKRSWRREGQNLMAHNLYRHKACFRDPKAALALFKDIPFLNGGLFECLDKDLGDVAKPRYLRIDGFSDRSDSQPTVPDFLFFGPEQELDLSEDYGDKKFRKVRVRGLIDTLNRYKFTIEENTPFDQEVALDPEMSGKVFENLLAAYNPETGTTARKATGSFYTPREIVDYMVDESLVAYLKGKLTTEDAEIRLRALLAYNADMPTFSETETEALIEGIDAVKALDPAVGSGAFPMGLLHKLVLVLGRLDPDNARWKATQIAKIDDAIMREEAERLFRENYDNYGRKLYLIENCIYGVDIQPIAVQIAKMRFFISLIVDQKVNPDAPNLGIRALPNLETKFVAANTLIGIERPEAQGKLFANPKVDELKTDLALIRHRMFTAKTTSTKNDLRKKDAALRLELAAEVEKTFRKANEDETQRTKEALLKATNELEDLQVKPVEWEIARAANLFGEEEETRTDPAKEKKRRLRDAVRILEARLRQATQFEEELDATATQLAAWDPYDQNEAASFFDPEWMFGVRDGFDLVIGNPPYGKILSVEDAKRLSCSCAAFGATKDAYVAFMLNGLHLLKCGGCEAYIVPSAWLGGPAYQSLRAEVLQMTLHQIIALPFDIFNSAYVDNVVFLMKKDAPQKGHKVQVYSYGKRSDLGGVRPEPWEYIAQAEWEAMPNRKMVLSQDGLRLHRSLLSTCSRTLADVVEMRRGVLFDESILTGRKTGGCSFRYFEGDIYRYEMRAAMSRWVELGPRMKEYPKEDRWFKGERILLRRLVNRKQRLMATLVDQTFVTNKNLYALLPKTADIDLKCFLAFLNSALFSRLYIDAVSQAVKDDFPQVTIADLLGLPFPDTVAAQDKDRLAHLVARILATKASDPSADTSALEREIDEIVYRLYGLTEEEVRIVKGGK